MRYTITMPALSAAQLHALIPELQHFLRQSTLVRVQGAGKQGIQLICSRENHTCTLVITLTGGQTTCFISPTPWATLTVVSPWSKWLHQCSVLDAEQLQSDRVLRLTLQAPDATTYHLVAELTGRHGNLLLLNGQNLVLAMAGRDHSQQRKLKPGLPYILPSFHAHPKAQQDSLHLSQLPPDGSRSQQMIQQWLQHQQTQQIQQIYLRLTKGQQYLQGRVEQLEAQLIQAQRHEEYRRWSELLPSAFGRVTRPASKVQVPDYYQAEAPVISIPLLPHLDLGGNIQRYAHQARRYAQAIPRLENQLLQAWENQQQLTTAQADIAAYLAESPPKLELAAERVSQLEQQHLLPPRNAPRISQEPAVRLPYRVYQSTVGQTIWVGRTARDNDTLTFKLARGNDYWLHARDTSGSHVVIRLNKNETLRPETQQEAALLAAHFSSQEKELAVEVMLTQVKHVRRLKGAPPGTVQVANSKTIRVQPLPQRWQQWSAQQEESCWN